jgi:Prokaryotic diacylglycerol kinase
MTNKFRTSGYHPAQKLKVILSGLYIAVITDFSVAYKVVLSAPILMAAFLLKQWVDANLILLATGLVLIAELFNSTVTPLYPKYGYRGVMNFKKSEIAYTTATKPPMTATTADSSAVPKSHQAAASAAFLVSSICF